ncbi:hypothetical protein HYPSUDRAFT_47760 [Hypholoma sublateritium FD-334 SS-4]|uniref:CP-type G domain-containing protein n=1 Tax=Hypholoma sublateritium (strain FD-334 SS-4) TaxID=945553 RepID=A0A0D2LYY8_HYPSF|nr:hypothetical protein HYPSUDRAFT_47760 [Hypholoma sublateritium FD-334 SS-4]
MPRIRKETSNRRSTNDRAKRRKQVKESKRKASKAAKKNPQWKSKTPKDPGIPSEFPYKDQILAEVAEARRKSAEEKEKKKADKQRAIAKARALARGEPWESEAEEEAEADADTDEEEEDEEGKPKALKKDLNVGIESIAALSAKHIGNALKPRPKLVVEEDEEEEEEEDVPVLINRDLPNLKSVLEKADVVLELLDTRDPMAYRSQHIESLAGELGKKVLLVLTKIDTCPREAVAQWSTHLRAQQPTLVFRSATSFLPEPPVQVAPKIKRGKGKAPKPPTSDAVGADSVLSCLSHWAKEKKGTEPLAVAVVGVTNVGKSAFINSLLKRSALPVYTLASSSRGPTTTELPQEVEIEADGQKIVLIDTPGLSFTAGEADATAVENHRAQDILLRSKGRIDRLKDPNPPIAQIVTRANVEDLMLLYNLPAFVGGNPTSFLSGVARASQMIKKKGELDLTGAARIVLRDWSVGKLAHFTLPSTKSVAAPAEPSTSELDPILAQLYANDETLLAGIPTRKEKRKEGGLVKLTASKSADERPAAIEQEWAGLQNVADSASDDDDDQPEDDDAEGMDVDSQEEEDEEEDEGEESDGAEEETQSDEEEQEAPPPPLSNKQKRKRVVEPERPSKKVAFAVAQSKKSKNEPIKPAQPKKPLKAIDPSLKKSSIKAQDKRASAPVKAAAKPKANPQKATSGGLVETASKTKVANKPPAKAKTAPSAGGKKDAAGEEAYDFGKFF